MEEPEGLDQFAAGAPNVRLVPPAQPPVPPVPQEDVVAASPPAPTERPYSERLSSPPERPSMIEPRLRLREPVFAMSVRFDPWEKEVLEKLAALEDRSQHQILKRLLRPVFEEAAKKLT